MAPKPILIDFPMPILSSRLLIRPCQAGDGAMVNAAVRETFPLLKRWLPWAQALPSQESSEIAMREFYAQFVLRQACHMVIFQRPEAVHQSPVFVGMCSFNQFDWSIPSAEIGYWLRDTAQGKGWMTEAVQALVVYGYHELGLRRLTIACEDKNRSSGAVAERAGFELEVRTKGLLSPVKTGGPLSWNRRYVRFDCKGLSKKDFSWGQSL